MNAYRRANESQDPRHTELSLFRVINRELAAAGEHRALMHALGRNHTLWSLLLRDLASEGNRLPAHLKQQLVGIGAWSMRYSTLAMLKDLPLRPLIEVNANVAAGLEPQTGVQAPPSEIGPAAHTRGQVSVA